MEKTTNMRTKFEPTKWNNVKEAGCYPYALNLLKNEFVLIGDFIGKRCTEKTSDEELLQTLREELNFLGYEVKEDKSINENCSKGEKRIYLQRDIHTGYYHLIRQDEDGMWSDKYPGELPTRTKIPFEGWCFHLKRAS